MTYTIRELDATGHIARRWSIDASTPQVAIYIFVGQTFGDKASHVRPTAHNFTVQCPNKRGILCPVCDCLITW